MKNTIKIPFSKKRTIIVLIGTLVVHGVIIYYHQQIIPFILGLNSLKAMIFAIIAELILILFLFFIIYQLLKPRRMLVLDEVGYTDQSGFLSMGRIKWKDIKEIKPTKDLFDEVLLVFLKNPEAYLSKVSNQFSLKMLNKNKEIYGTCFLIKPKLFKYNTQDLKYLIMNRHRMYGFTKKIYMK